MLDFRMLGLGALGAVLATALFVWPMADGAGYQRGRKEATAEIAAMKRAGLRMQAERDQARAEVAKVNAAIAAQVEELAKLMSADQAERSAAAKRMEAAAISAAVEAKRAGERALAAREVIQNVADQCARAGVPDDALRVLRNITGGSADLGEGRVSASQGHH